MRRILEGHMIAQRSPANFSLAILKALSTLEHVTLEETLVPVRLLRENQIASYLHTWAYGADVITSSLLSVLVAGRLGFDAIPDCLSRPGKSWHIKELSLSDKWLVGVLAYTDERFLKLLKTQLQSHWSPFHTSLYPWLERAFEREFGIKTVKCHVELASTDKKILFSHNINKFNNVIGYWI